MNTHQIIDSYIIVMVFFVGFFQGYQDGSKKKISRLQSYAVALTAGVIWPVIVGYGIWLTHFKKRA